MLLKIILSQKEKLKKTGSRLPLPQYRNLIVTSYLRCTWGRRQRRRELTWDFINRGKHRALHSWVAAAASGLLIKPEWQVLGGSRAVSKAHHFIGWLDGQVQKCWVQGDTRYVSAKKLRKPRLP